MDILNWLETKVTFTCTYQTKILTATASGASNGACVILGR